MYQRDILLTLIYGFMYNTVVGTHNRLFLPSLFIVAFYFHVQRNSILLNLFLNKLITTLTILQVTIIDHL